MVAVDELCDNYFDLEAKKLLPFTWNRKFPQYYLHSDC